MNEEEEKKDWWRMNSDLASIFDFGIIFKPN